MLEVRSSIDQGTLIDIIAAGLPGYVADRLNRDELEETKDLFNDIGRLEHLVQKRNSEKKFNRIAEGKTKISEKTPCKNCEKSGRGVRYHPETKCWFNQRKEEGTGKQTNMSLIESELIESDQKNEY